MGAERLTAALLVLATGCGAAGAIATRDARDPRDTHASSSSTGVKGAKLHFQIVHAMSTKERADIAARFREINGAGWNVMLGTGEAPDDVDPLFRVIRRAKRETAVPQNVAVDAIDEAAALTEATAFLSRNASFLGLGAGDVATLDMTATRPTARVFGSWAVRAHGLRPARGYEGFSTLTSMIDIVVYLGDDGALRYFVNASRVHPRLSLDTTPALGPDDPRVLRHVVGRELFAVLDDPRLERPRVRELTRISLGKVSESDVHAVRLAIHVSPGPRAVYVTYQLAYAVAVFKGGHVFRFVVDADTGALLEDAVVPIVPNAEDPLAP